MNIQDVFKALGNDKRLQILEWLKDPVKHFPEADCLEPSKGVCVGLIERKIGLSQSTVSQYLCQMQKAGLISMSREGQWTYYRYNSEGITKFINRLAETL